MLDRCRNKVCAAAQWHRPWVQAPKSEHDVPRVSPYRLAAHLGSAFAIYAVLLWTTLSLAVPEPVLARGTEATLAAAGRLRGAVHPLAGLIALTAMSGASAQPTALS